MIASDCLILLSGINAGEMVVIERTPTRSFARTSDQNWIVVTNDYKQLSGATSVEGNVLQQTSCGRFDRVSELLSTRGCHTPNESFDILKDHRVKMDITVQQMVFNNSNGQIELITPYSSEH